MLDQKSFIGNKKLSLYNIMNKYGTYVVQYQHLKQLISLSATRLIFQEIIATYTYNY